MLTLGPKSRTIERILKTPTGGFVRATFLVVEFQGQVKAKLIKAEAIEAPKALSAAVLALPGTVLRPTFETVLSIGRELIVSPYVNFDFFNAQPTRAPNL
jgi:hypothetical protein